MYDKNFETLICCPAGGRSSGSIERSYVIPDTVKTIKREGFNGALKDTLGNSSGILPYVLYSDDFRIVIDGESAGNPRYTLYSNEGEHLYDSDSFLPPDSKGEYFLLVTLIWSNNDIDQYLEYSGFQYWFNIIIG